jgi:hypothetical protein
MLACAKKGEIACRRTAWQMVLQRHEVLGLFYSHFKYAIQGKDVIYNMWEGKKDKKKKEKKWAWIRTINCPLQSELARKVLTSKYLSVFLRLGYFAGDRCTATKRPLSASAPATTSMGLKLYSSTQ